MGDEIFLIETARPGATGGNVATVDWTTIRTEVDALLERPAITELGDVPNVDETGATDGQTLLRSGSGYVLGDPSGAIASVENTGVEVMPDVHTLDFEAGLTAYDSGTPGKVGLGVTFGGTGISTSLSRSDHNHLPAIQFVYPYAASGNLSSGFREIAVGNPTINAGVPFLVTAALRSTVRGGGGGASYYTIALNIGGTLHVSEIVYCVGGVPQERTFTRSKQVTGDGTAMGIAAAINYSSGDPTDIRAGELVVTLYPAK